MDSVSVWKGLCPPKVELFLWQLLRGRVMVREVLRRFGVVLNGDSGCPLCNDPIESVDHLFLLCPWSWGLWMYCLGWWTVHCCINLCFNDWFLCWIGLCPRPSMRKAWETLFFAVIWTIWEAKNQRVFNGKSVELMVFFGFSEVQSFVVV